jgi:hypothetical protein
VCRDFDLGSREKAAQPETRRATPVDAPPASLLVISPAASEAARPVAESADGAGQPAQDSLREAYDSGSPDAKRRTFSFL